MSNMKEFWSEANDAFYAWEQETKRTDLSDRDRELWCLAYVEGKLSERRL